MANHFTALTFFTICFLIVTESAALTDLTTTPPQQQTQRPTSELIVSHTAIPAAILSHLGFNEFANAAPSLSTDVTSWSGPTTVFASSDSSLRTCFSCSDPLILHEHLIPSLFTINYLLKLSFGTKIETPSHCIIVTSRRSQNNKILIEVLIANGSDGGHRLGIECPVDMHGIGSCGSTGGTVKSSALLMMIYGLLIFAACLCIRSETKNIWPLTAKTQS